MNISSKNIKKERIKISSLDDFKDALKKEGYKINEFDEEKFKDEIIKKFDVDNRIIERLYTSINEHKITYRVNDSKDLIDYIKKIILFESLHNKLWKKISAIKTLIIDRIEYEREPRIQENVEEMVIVIEKLSNDISGVISEEGKVKLEELEKGIGEKYLYAKDVELLKKMLIVRKEGIKEIYNTRAKTKTIFIEIPKEINDEYIKAKKGSVQYHEYLTKNIPRMQRLIKNLHKYIKADKEDNKTFKINQSEVLQDSINIAVAVYDEKEFRAISGSDEIEDYCRAPLLENAAFKSSKVNKLGKLGIGYDRVNDSEKKIFEEIHKQIEENVLKNQGDLVLYSKWESCPSCYYVIYQFKKKHPDINVQVRYIKRYGE